MSTNEYSKSQLIHFQMPKEACGFRLSNQHPPISWYPLRELRNPIVDPQTFFHVEWYALHSQMIYRPHSGAKRSFRSRSDRSFDHVQIDPASLKLPHIIRYDSKTQLLTKLVWFLHNLLELLAQKKAAAVDSSVEGWTYDLWRITLKLRQVLSCCLAGQHWEVGFIHLILLLRPPVAGKLPEDILAGDGHKFRGLSFIIGIDTSGVT